MGVNFPDSQDPNLTPLMKQYWDLKRQAPDALLLFRMGDFYELFGDDAIEASRILEITLTSRDKNKANPTPMAGVPHHSVAGYLQRLLKAGKKVAIGEQMEDPSTLTGSKTIVRREIVRVLTPAIQFDHEQSETAYLATALSCELDVAQSKQKYRLACLDPSTGETRVSSPLLIEELMDELASSSIRHVLKTDDAFWDQIAFSGESVLVEKIPSNYLPLDSATRTLKEQYGLSVLETFFKDSTSIQSLGILVFYTLRSQKTEKLTHLQLPKALRDPSHLELGPRTAQHLDLISSESQDLFGLINQASSALGSRTLKRWILEPLKIPSQIMTRQEGIREFTERAEWSEKISSHLKNLYDLERICGRANAGLASPRDVQALGKSLALCPQLSQWLTPFKSESLDTLKNSLTELKTLLEPLSLEINSSLKNEQPLTTREGKIFNKGVSPELDRLIELNENGEKWLVDLEQRERDATGIPSLKVRYNRVFGYYIEITTAHLKNAPTHYQRKQTTVGGERFFTEELKKFEDEIVHAAQKQKNLEIELFEALLEKIKNQIPRLMELAQILGQIDAQVALAQLGWQPGWCFPVIDESLDLEISSGRHPLVDRNTKGLFVPNDVKLSPNSHLTLLITGPNMGGKSTVMRQAALIVVLGQMGAPVPAQMARWGAVSKLYTRIGAQDAISRGQSTFMVEMSELAHILHHADSRSLLILDEIGRGTSTYDGISVAWSTLEYLTQKIKARTLFATHYHELTQLEGSLPHLGNAHMAVESTKSIEGGKLRFLYQLKAGAAEESFGIHVARMAGLPAGVISRSWEVLDHLEKSHHSENSTHSMSQGNLAHADTSQLSLFGDSPENPTPPLSGLKTKSTLSAESPEWVKELAETSIEALTPLEALNLLNNYKNLAKTNT